MGLSKSKIKYIQSLKEKKYREQYNTFVAEGDKMVTDLLPVMSCELLVATPDFLQSRSAIINNAKEVIKVEKSDINKASFLKNPQQVVAVFKRPQHALSIDKIRNQLSLMLDGIQDPGNMGTIIRLADWYGIENIICSKDTVDVYNPKVVQATMGALARVKLYYTDLTETIEKLNDTPVYGTFLDGEDLYTTKISETGIIIMGNEGKGIRPEISKCINRRLYIPNYPKERETSESLNVAIATAIICSEFRRRLS